MLNKIALQLFSDFSFFIRLCSTDPQKIQNESGFYIQYLYCIYINPKCRELVTDKSISIISDSTSVSGSHTVTKIYNHRLMVAHCYKITNIIGTLCISIRTLCISIKPLCISLERLLNVSQLEDC